MIAWRELCLQRFIKKPHSLEHYNVSNKIARAMLGEVLLDPKQGKDIYEEVFLAWAWNEAGESLSKDYCYDLEERVRDHMDIWPIATRIHAAQHDDRVTQSRIKLSHQQLPFSLFNALDDLQVEVLACGDKILNALHVDWVRKLARHTLKALPLDCQNVGFWFAPILDVLPEEDIKKSLKKLKHMRKIQEGSLGLAAFYAWRLNMDEHIFLSRATQRDKDLFSLAKEVY